MKKHSLFSRCLILLLTLVSLNVYAASEGELKPGMENPGSEEKPDWFKISFLDLYDDIDEAAEDNKRVMLYFYQDGCPYCKLLLEDNFGQRNIALKTQKYFDVVAINLWGDNEVTFGDHEFTEKTFAAALKVQYTPTLVFFNEDKKPVFRADGYYSPEKFNVVLDFIGTKKEHEIDFRDYLAKVSPQPAVGRLYTEVATVTTPDDLSTTLNNDRHLLVFFEQKKCVECDELHQNILQRPDSKTALNKFDRAIVDIWDDRKIIKPDGKLSTVKKWVKELDINYAPSMVYFNDKGVEVFRSAGYLKAFHLQSIMEYVASGAYKKQANFQRYIDSRADSLEEQGVEVELMK